MLPRSSVSREVYNLNDELTTVAVSVSDHGDHFKISPSLKSQVFILCESENFARTASFYSIIHREEQHMTH